jgi:aspartate ammonia-lyase
MVNQSIHFRVEHDIAGDLPVPADVYYGAQTLRAMENFPITGRRMHPEMIKSLVLIKKAAAIVNCEAGTLPRPIADAIVKACDEILCGKFTDQFPVDPIQGGAGTSANMNANEVIANRAIELMGGIKGDYSLVHPNDHVNCGQSTNDVYPSSGKMTAARLLKGLEAALADLRISLEDKAVSFSHVIKMGRTQLQDAVPIRLGQEFHAYALAVGRDIGRLRLAGEGMRVLNLGGTAIGTGINATAFYVRNIVPAVSRLSGESYTQAEDLVDSTQNMDCYIFVSGALKCCAVTLGKICNDLRLMSSGPRAGLGEITLPARQNGSSIMPGKVNPVIPEAVNQIAFNVIGNDTAVTLAAEAGQLELNAFEPLIFHKLFESAAILANGVRTLNEHCIKGIAANEKRCKKQVEESTGVVTALCPYIGYARAASLAKEALGSGMSVKELALREGLLSEQEIHEVLDPYAMTSPQDMPNEALTAVP